MQHNFDVSIATEYGVNVAIFLNHLAFWVEKNAVNKKHFHRGHYWTYNSQEAFTILFPYLSRKMIRTIINNCIKNDLILVDNFNDTKYDRTQWYTFTNKGLSLFPHLKNQIDRVIHSIGPKGTIENKQRANRFSTKGQPIPDIKPDIKPDRESPRENFDQKEDEPKPKKKKTKIRKDFVPNPDHLQCANELGLPLDKEKQKFINYYLARGTPMEDWNACFMAWLEKAKGFNAREGSIPSQGYKPMAEREHEFAKKEDFGTINWERGQKEVRKIKEMLRGGVLHGT